MFGPNNVILITHTRDIYLTWDLIILHSNMYTQQKTFFFFFFDKLLNIKHFIRLQGDSPLPCH
jgi:hypothetical protein